MNAAGMQLAQLVAERAVNSLAGGLLIAALAWLVLRVVGKQNSGTRFAVWFSALLAIFAVPFVPGVNPAGGVAEAMHAEIELPGFWAIAIFAVWILFAALALTRMLIGLRNLRRLRNSGLGLTTSSLHPALQETLAQCQAIRPVTVCSSSEVSVPTVMGFFKPVILIPEWALRDLTIEELRVILLHEFAHLRRWDDWTNLAQKLVRTVFFFHPAVWWIEKRLSLEREMACDDAVLAETGNPRAYAECLVSLAEKSFLQRGLAMAQAAVSRARETSLRLAQILDADRPRATRVFKPALALMTAFAGVCLVILPDAPRLIGFENQLQPVSVATASAPLPRRTAAYVVPASMVVPAVVPAVVPETMRTGIEPGAVSANRKVVATPAVYRPAKSAGRRSAERKSGRLSLPQVVAATQERSRNPVFATPAVANLRTPAPEFLVVMQTAEFDDQGSVVLSVRMWRVTFAAPRLNRVQQGVAAKST